MKINHLIILRKQAKQQQLTGTAAKESGDEGESSAATKQQPDIIAPESSGERTGNAPQETNYADGEMTALHKLLWFYKNASKVLWRVAEIHASKAVSLVIMLVVVQQVHGTFRRRK